MIHISILKRFYVLLYFLCPFFSLSVLYFHAVSQGGVGLPAPRGQDINTEMFYFIAKPLLLVVGRLRLFLDQSASCLSWNECFDALPPMKKPQHIMTVVALI